MSSNSNNNNNSMISSTRDGVLFLLLLSATSPDVCESFSTASTAATSNSRSLSVTSPSPHKKRRPAATTAVVKHRHEPASSSRVVLNSFEYLGKLWKDEDYGEATNTGGVGATTTAYAEPYPTVEFQPLPAQPQAPTYYSDDFFYDNSGSKDYSFPTLPAPPPPGIANPYDMTPMAEASLVTDTAPSKIVDFQALRDAAADIIPSVVAAIPRPDVRNLASSLTRIQPMQQVMPKIRVPETTKKPSVIQGKSIRTWNLLQQTSGTTMMLDQKDQVKSVEVSLSTNGRPLNAEIELWQGPDHAPQKIAVYSEDGKARPLRTVVVATSPQTTSTSSTTGHIRSSTTVAVKNAAEMEFPLTAECKEAVDANYGSDSYMRNTYDDMNNYRRGNTNRYNNRNGQMSIVPHRERLMWQTRATSKVTTATRTVQGGASTVLPAFPSSVRSVQVFITNTDGVPVTARVEVLQGPNNIKQLIEVYCEDGKLRPFGAILELPSGNLDGSIADMGLDHVLRVVNTGPLEFPFEVRVEPYSLDDEDDDEQDYDNYFGSNVVDRDFYYFDVNDRNNLADVRSSSSNSGGAYALNDYRNANKAYFLN